MHIKFRNVNDAFHQFTQGMCWGTIHSHKEDTRNGDCYVVTEPVLCTYTSPKERVLWNKARNANPFLHYIEALWMLAGRNDVATLSWFASNMTNYSDDGKTLHAAYGHRWATLATEHTSGPSYHIHYQHTNNQLRDLVSLLKEQPNTRRGVLSMWDPNDLHRVATYPTCKDVACNTHAYFELEPIATMHPSVVQSTPSLVSGNRKQDSIITAQPAVVPQARRVVNAFQTKQLNMTVCNRSNDLLWGMLGSNFVTFSILQEYLAAHIGVEVGTYHHFTNNLHVYTDKAQFDKWLKAHEPDLYFTPDYVPQRLVQDPAIFDKELPWLFEDLDNLRTVKSEADIANYPHKDRELTEPALHAAFGMASSWYFHKQRDYHKAVGILERWAMSPDWRHACVTWMENTARRYTSDHPVPNA